MSDLSESAERSLIQLSRRKAAEVEEDLVDDGTVPEDRREGVVGAVRDYVREDGYLRDLARLRDVLLDVEDETQRREDLSMVVPAALDGPIVQLSDALDRSIEYRAEQVAEEVRDDAINMIIEETEGSL